MGEFDVLANVILVTPARHATRILEQVVTLAGTGAADGRTTASGCLAGASRLPHDAGLVYKVLGTETQPVKAQIRAFWDLARREVAGAPAPASASWE
jgi:urease accessory protein